jgi:hypothetical protein
MPMAAIGQIDDGPSIRLIRVLNEDQEAVVLDRLERACAGRPCRTAPVLDRGRLPERLREAFAEAGASVRIDNFVGNENVCWPSLINPDQAPGLLAVGDDVATSVARLASVVSGRPVTTFEALTDDVLSQIRTRSAVLIGSRRPGLKASAAIAFHRLQSAGFRVGIVWGEEAICARFVILKALLVTRIACVRRVGRISASMSTEATNLAPPFLFDGQHSAAGWFREKRDVLVASGHANGIDALLHPDLILCSRKGAPTRDYTELPVFTCFNDGLCFRLANMGRDGRTDQALVSPDEADCRVMVLIGCTVATLGPTWHSAESSLISRAVQGSALAIVTSLTKLLESLQLDLLLMALLMDGRTLGDAVEELNTLRARTGTDTAEDSPSAFGPLVVFGNPMLQLDGFGVQSVPAHRAGDFVTISLEGLTADADGVAWLKCHVGADVHYVALQTLPKDTWCSGAVTSSGDLYLCVRAPISFEPRCISVRLYQRDPSRSERAAIGSFITGLRFWLTLLQTCHSDRISSGRSVVDFERELRGLPETMVHFMRTAVRMKPVRGLVAQPIEPAWQAIFRSMAEASARLLSLVLQTADADGGVRIHEWASMHEFIGIERADGACSCGNSRVRRYRYRSPDSGSGELWDYECEVCGASGFDDGRSTLRIAERIAHVHAGATMNIVVDICAPVDECVICAIVAVLQGLVSGPVHVSKGSAVFVQSGRTQRVNVPIVVPVSIAPGLYPLAIVAAVNGGLSYRKRILHVLPSRSGGANADQR